MKGIKIHNDVNSFYFKHDLSIFLLIHYVIYVCANMLYLGKRENVMIFLKVVDVIQHF